MKKLFIIPFLIFSFSCFAQDKRGTIKVKKVNSQEDNVEVNENGTFGQQPMFPGGQTEMYKFFKKNIKYPEAEKKAGIQGTVYVKFTVWTDGTLTGSKILKGVSGGPGLEVEALRLVSIMPKWTPGIKNGKVTYMHYSLPIKFQL